VRKLELPTVDDIAAINSLSKRGKHIRAVAAKCGEIAVQYEQYMNGRGNPWVVAATNEFDDIKAALHSLYKNPPNNFEFIDQLREGSEGSCPVCGGGSAATLDHHLPKEVFPQFSLYSRNLVPACFRCNNIKGLLYQGQLVGQRGVHPYFDDFAAGRVISVVVEGPWAAPKIFVVPFNVAGDAALAVEWQIENIIKPAGIERKLKSLWGQLVAKPAKALLLNAAPADADAIRLRLLEMSESAAHMQLSDNDWQSVFYFGVAQSPGAPEHILSLY
jgi:hypothetical protein